MPYSDGMKTFIKTLVIIMIALSLTGCYGKRKAQRNVYNNPVPTKPAEDEEIKAAMAEIAAYVAKIDALVNYAMEYVGCPYQYGAIGPDSFDCSGFTRHVFRNFDIELNRIAADQLANGAEIKSTKDLLRGDLVFFRGRDMSDENIGHVGIVTEVDNETGHFSFIHASSSGVRVTKSTDAYYKKRYITACRIIF